MHGWYLACADPVRLKILSLMRFQPLCVCIIKTMVKIADSKLSSHLTSLKKAGLIDGEQQGLYIIYQSTPAAQAFIRNEFKRYGYTLPRKRAITAFSLPLKRKKLPDLCVNYYIRFGIVFLCRTMVTMVNTRVHTPRAAKSITTGK